MNGSATVRLLSGGAAQGLVSTLASRFQTSTGWSVSGTYSAVGAMKDALLAGAPADLVILTRALIDTLAASGHVHAQDCADLGAVRTGIAVPDRAPKSDVSSAQGLRRLLAQAAEIHFPDPERATAGIHFMKVLDALDLREAVRTRLRPHPNGTTAMREMARAEDPGAVGCTQITEIIATPGAQLLGPLPREYELATVYTAAVCTRAAAPEAARRLIALLTGAESRAQRTAAGFE